MNSAPPLHSSSCLFRSKDNTGRVPRRISNTGFNYFALSHVFPAMRGSAVPGSISVQTMRTVMQLVLRLAIRTLALAGVAIGICWIAFDLTVICVIPAGSGQFFSAQISLERFSKVLERYRADCGGYPDPKIGLAALVVNPQISGWNGPYTKDLLIDPWGRPYRYEILNGIPNVRSLGADGKQGGDWFDGDLSSQNPTAPLHESKLHVARRFLRTRLFPWLFFGTSLYAWFARHRWDLVVFRMGTHTTH